MNATRNHLVVASGPLDALRVTQVAWVGEHFAVTVGETTTPVEAEEMADLLLDASGLGELSVFLVLLAEGSNLSRCMAAWNGGAGWIDVRDGTPLRGDALRAEVVGRLAHLVECSMLRVGEEDAA